ncbi:MAG: hypothetical protein Q9219_002098 [cf. Caloplaca sp. 3 TL-2023]
MALDSSHSFMNKPLPTPADAPYNIPSRADSRQSSRAGWYSPWPSLSSPRSHARADSSSHARGESNGNLDDSIALTTDERRFTPNLHASLVSEILSLRREIETKNNALTSLEEGLQSSKVDNSQLAATVNSREQEIRSVKKQMQLLESGTLSALGDMAKERDDALYNLTDVRKRLEASKNAFRTQEEDARRCQDLWDQDKQNWDNERRNMERKVHVAEGRLRTMVNEVAAIQANNQHVSVANSDLEEANGDTWFSNWSDIISTRSSSVRGRYHLSEVSNNTYDSNELANLRNSIVPGRNSISGMEPNSLNLADELQFEETGEHHDTVHELQNGVISPDALPEENPFRPRRLSIQSQDCKARRILGLQIDTVEQQLGGQPPAEENSSTILGKFLPPLQFERKWTPTHQDTGTQFSPPASPKAMTPEHETAAERDVGRNANTENTANQSRKRVSVAVTPYEFLPFKSESIPSPKIISVGCQTTPQPASPPLVPMIALEPLFPDPATLSGLNMVSSSTQTESESQLASETAGFQRPTFPSTVPVIAIHPPNSRPGSAYNNVVLPPRTKNASSQTMLTQLADLKSVATQTESIRVDKRPLGIPQRLMSADTSFKPQSQRSQSPRRSPSKTRKVDLRRPPPVELPRTRIRSSNIQNQSSEVIESSDVLSNRGHKAFPISPASSDNPFAGFSDQEGSAKEIDFSDDDDFATVAPIRKTLSKVQNSWKLVPASMNANQGSRPLGRPISDIQEIDDTTEAGSPGRQANIGRSPLEGLMGPNEKAGLPFNASRNPGIRKAALISSGALAHARQRSPSEPGPSTASAAVPPPFPVPTRSSSRKIPISSSEGNGSPTPYATSFIAGARNRTKAPPSSRNPLRKVRSAAAVPKFALKQGTTDGENTPPVKSQASTPLSSPLLPRILRTESSPQVSSTSSQKKRQEATAPDYTATETVTESPGQITSVVDAIAQTMVGEWMLKYVRKRKSFGIAESPQVEFEGGRHPNENNSGIRHKRWVWLAPYERAVIWSSKQPTNGSALLGKGGRKRKAPGIYREVRELIKCIVTIQSVLDVRDDTPLPKNAGMQPNFGRSILILTPERALKFTAPNRDRHYIWLTALSFLSHATFGMEDLAVLPAVPRTEYQPSSSEIRGRARRSPRDSIRVAKSKERPQLQARNYTAPTAPIASLAGAGGSAYDATTESVSDAAEPPRIPRLSAHTRKRSNTGPRPGLPSAFHSFPAHLGISSSHQARSATPPDIARSNNTPGAPYMRHQSETTLAQPEPVRNDFFDVAGMVRMEAFIDDSKQRTADADRGRRLPHGSHRTRQGRKKDMGYWGIMGETGNQEVPAVEGKRTAWKGEDPFRGI